MTVVIALEGRAVTFTLDETQGRWHSSEEQKEGDFPLVTVTDGKRYELYSDGKFARVER